MFSIFRSLRSFAIFALSTGQLTLRPNGNVALAAPTLETRYVGPFSGRGHLAVRQGSTTIGCINANGHWTTGGQCAVFSAAPQGGVATQLTTSAGQCGLDTTFELVCEVGNPNGPENWHVSFSSFPFRPGVLSMLSSRPGYPVRRRGFCMSIVA